MAPLRRLALILGTAAAEAACAARPAPAPPTAAVSTADAPFVARLAPPGVARRPIRALVGTAVAPTHEVDRAFTQPLVPRHRTRAVVLLYHGFDRGPDPLSVRSRRLERQLAWLRGNDVEIVSTTELVEFMEGERWLPARVAVITIDDGMLSVYERAWPILRRHRARFTLGLSTALLADPKPGLVMTWDHVRDMLDSGLCEIASHGHRHRRLVGLGNKLAREELVVSAEVIERETGRVPAAYFFPLGAHDADARRRVKDAGYRAAFTASGAPIASGSAPIWQIPRTSIFHGDGLGRFAWYFSDENLDRAPIASRTTRISSTTR